MKATGTTVFNSYSHDSDAHEARVLALADRLRNEGGQACEIDRYEQSPPLGWPRWCEERIEESRFVLVVWASSRQDHRPPAAVHGDCNQQLCGPFTGHWSE